MSKTLWIAPALQALLERIPEGSKRDLAIVGLTLYAEARSEPIEGIVAVGNVIASRAKDAKQRWPATLPAVCLQPHQFSCWHRFPNAKGEDRNYDKLVALATALAGGIVPSDPAVEECAAVATMILKGALRDRVKGANHYHAALLQPRPSWAQAHAPTIQVGRHVFYQL